MNTPTPWVSKVAHELYKHRDNGTTGVADPRITCTCGWSIRREYLDPDRSRIPLWLHQAHAIVTLLIDRGWATPEQAKQWIAETVREVVDLATNHQGDPSRYMEWVALVRDVQDGMYTPPEKKETPDDPSVGSAERDAAPPAEVGGNPAGGRGPRGPSRPGR